MKVENAQLRHTHHYGFRSGEWADITGVAVVTPTGLDSRLAFVIRFSDGVVDYVAVNDMDNYEIR